MKNILFFGITSTLVFALMIVATLVFGYEEPYWLNLFLMSLYFGLTIKFVLSLISYIAKE